MEVGAISRNFNSFLIFYCNASHAQDPHVNLCQGEVDLELFNAVLEDLEANALKVQKQRKREVRTGV